MTAAWSLGSAIVSRGAFYLLLWLVLAGYQVADLPAAAFAVVAATWVSLWLLPPLATTLRPWWIAVMMVRFLVQSVLAGVDVAWRVMRPQMRLRPGFVTFVPQLPPGTAFEAFCTLSSLLPGTLPSGTDGQGGLVVHCLDVGQDVPAQMAAEERLFLRAIGRADRG